MKKSLVFMIAVLLVGALMISCNGDVSNNSDNLVTVSLKTDTSKGLSTTPSSNITGVENLYWYFTATKTDGSMFTTGATSAQIPVVSAGETGLNNKYIGGSETKRMFSTGSWSFSFYGYKNYSANSDPAYSDLVYKCENLAVTITGNTELTLTLDTASDSPAQLTLGSPNPYWRYDNAVAGTRLTLKIYEGSTLLATSTGDVDNNHEASFSELKVNDVNADYVELTAGIHNLNFEVWYGGEKVGKSTLNLNAKANNSYPVTGDIAVLDSTFWVHINSVTKSTAVIESTSPTVAVMSVQISPLSATTGVSETSTTVNFAYASGVETADGTTYSLAVDVLAGTGVSVSATSENVNVANIDLTLTKTTSTGVENVTSFEGSNNEGYVTVTTFIGKDLTNVKVEGVAANNGTSDSNADSGISNVTYTPTTGALSFNTTHFSEFAVTSDAVATITKNESTVYYSTLASAFDDAESGDTIILYADSATSVSYTVPAGKTLIVDFNGKTVTSSKVSNGNDYVGFIENNGTLTFTDTSNGEAGGVVSSNNIVVVNNGTMVIEKGKIEGHRKYTIDDATTDQADTSTIYTMFARRGVVHNNGTMTINSGASIFTEADFGVLNLGQMTINGGSFVSASDSTKKDDSNRGYRYSYCVTSYAGTMTINNASVTGVHGLIGVNGGVATINNVTTSFNSGSSFYALYVAGEVGTPVATVNGGSFAKGSGLNSLYVGNRNDGGAGNLAMVTIAGGSFEGNFYYTGVTSSYGDGRLEITGGSFSINPYPNVNHETHEVWKDDSTQKYIVVATGTDHTGYSTQVSE